MNTTSLNPFEYLSSPAFSDHRNITIGDARIIWAKETQTMEEGYVLPGGKRTQDKLYAHSVAVRLNRLLDGGK